MRSDFSTVLKLWEAYRAAHEDLTQSKLRDWCERNFLSFMRMREWRELHRQLLLLIGELGWQQETLVESPDSRTDAVAYERLHRALLSGFPAQVAHKDEKGLYLGTRGRKYAIFPGSHATGCSSPEVNPPFRDGTATPVPGLCHSQPQSNGSSNDARRSARRDVDHHQPVR